MKNKYLVRHYSANPRNNSSAEFSDKTAALEDLRKMTSDQANSGTSSMFRNGELIAYRDWDKVRVSWVD